MMKKERKSLSVIMNSVIIAAIIIALLSVPTNVKGQGFQFEWSNNTGSPVVSVDISDGSPIPSEVYVVSGSEQRLSLYDGEGNLEWYKNKQIADYWTFGTSHAVAISGNAQYVVAGDKLGYVHVYDISGNLLWDNDMPGSNGDCYSVDVSNPDKNDYGKAYVVSCSGDRFYVYDVMYPWLYWSEQIGSGYVINVKISENGDWIAVSSNKNRIELWNQTIVAYTPQHHKVWSYNTVEEEVNIDLGRTGLVVVAGDDNGSNGGPGYVYEFDAGDDWQWETLDDNVPGWIRQEPRDIYGVAVSDSEIISTSSPPFSVISGRTYGDSDSEESYYYSSTKIRSWPTGIAYSAAATFDDRERYDFRMFGSPDHNIYLVAQDSNIIIDTYTTGGIVNTTEISYSYLHETDFDYFVAGSSDGYVYFFTYDYP